MTVDGFLTVLGAVIICGGIITAVKWIMSHYQDQDLLDTLRNDNKTLESKLNATEAELVMLRNNYKDARLQLTNFRNQVDPRTQRIKEYPPYHLHITQGKKGYYYGSIRFGDDTRAALQTTGRYTSPEDLIKAIGVIGYLGGIDYISDDSKEESDDNSN